MYKTYVIGNDHAVYKLFLNNSRFTMVKQPNEAEVIVWTGGSDISPTLYDEKPLHTTHVNLERDRIECAFFDKFPDAFKVGICRGGQLLNTLSGGKMWQDVDNHTRDHYAIDLTSGKKVWLTSTHHQMMIPGPGCEVIAVAEQSTYRHSYGKLINKHRVQEWAEVGKDIEVVWYEKTKSFCFQGHPEYENFRDDDKATTRRYFFAQLMNKLEQFARV